MRNTRSVILETSKSLSNRENHSFGYSSDTFHFACLEVLQSSSGILNFLCLLWSIFSVWALSARASVHHQLLAWALCCEAVNVDFSFRIKEAWLLPVAEDCLNKAVVSFQVLWNNQCWHPRVRLQFVNHDRSEMLSYSWVMCIRPLVGAWDFLSPYIVALQFLQFRDCRCLILKTEIM